MDRSAQIGTGDSLQRQQRNAVFQRAGAWVEKGHAVVLIACSQLKRPGGEPWTPVGGLVDQLSATDREALLSVRSSFAHHCGICSGQDVGGTSDDGSYLPASRRYNGRVYGRVDEASWPVQPKPTVIIVSALYGLVFPWEPIQYYDLTMNSSVGGRSRVSRRWREVGLGRILANWCSGHAVVGVIDLLSQPYRKALDNLIDLQAVGIDHLSFDYPGRFQAGNLDRGNDLQALLRLLPQRG